MSGKEAGRISRSPLPSFLRASKKNETWKKKRKKKKGKGEVKERAGEERGVRKKREGERTGRQKARKRRNWLLRQSNKI